jgi:hypothetical protein
MIIVVPCLCIIIMVTINFIHHLLRIPLCMHTHLLTGINNLLKVLEPINNQVKT